MVCIAREERTAAWIVGMLTLLLIAGWLVGVYLVGRYRAVVISPWSDPRSALDWRDIDPVVALGELGGSGVRTVYETALQKDDIATAYATIVYAIGLAPEQRCGLLLSLARSSASGDRGAIQGSCYHMAASVATVAADMSDLTRARTLLEAGRGMADQRALADALFYLDQVYTIARFSDRLALAHRRALLDELIPLYQRLGRSPETWQALADQVFTPVAPAGEKGFGPPSLPRPELLYLSEAVLQATASRQRMAQQVLEAVTQDKGAITGYQLEDLASVLLHEDRARQQSHSEPTDRDHRILVARDRVAWHALKSRIAHKGFGVSILPEWEAQAAKIDAELRIALDGLYTEYRASEGNAAQGAILCMQIEYGMLGFYPDWPQAEWADQLSRLEPQQALYLGAQTERQRIKFYLVGKSQF